MKAVNKDFWLKVIKVWKAVSISSSWMSNKIKFENRTDTKIEGFPCVFAEEDVIWFPRG